ncbi:CRP-like cAMP-binding protein [Bradyrhizobium sp. GM24.11]
MEGTASEFWLRRLRTSARLDGEDERQLRELPFAIRRMEGNQGIVATGDRPSVCCLVVDGFVLRSKSLAEGKRQILAFHQPGTFPTCKAYISTSWITM